MDPDGMKTSALEIAASFSRRQDMALLQAAAAAMEVGGYFWWQDAWKTAWTWQAQC